MYTDTAPVHLSPLAIDAMTAPTQAPAAIDERPDAEIIALMYGPLPTRRIGEKASAGVAKQDDDKETKGEPAVEEETVIETTEDGTEAISEDDAKENNPKDTVDTEKAPRDDYMDCINCHSNTVCKGETKTSESESCDDDTLEGARLLASLHTAG